jgi:hypothetical protein
MEFDGASSAPRVEPNDARTAAATFADQQREDQPSARPRAAMDD